jgi:glycosyltransferase involved in cell wall biosynthesis
MKILLIANGIDSNKPGLSGGEVRFIEIAKHWESLGYEIELLSNKGGVAICTKLGLKLSKVHIYKDIKLQGRVGFIYKTAQSIFSLPSSLVNFDGLIYSANEMVFDVIPALKLIRSTKNKNLKWGVVVHWLPPFPPWKRKESTLLNSTLFFINQRLSLYLANKYATKLFAVSKSTYVDVLNWGGNPAKLVEVGCGVNLDDIKPFVNNSEITKKYDAVFMKRLQAVKGVFDIINAWAEVCRVNKNAQLLIIGEGIDGERARLMVENMGLSNNITFSGPLFDFNYKFSLLKSCKLFVLPTYEENWAIVIGEALSIGLPVITYRLKELVEVWGDAIITIDLGDVKKFSLKILELLGDEKLLDLEIEKTQINIEKYDWKNISNLELESLLT